MSIDTNAGIHNGYFGIWKTMKNGNQVFVKKGNAVYLTAIEESLETDDVFWLLEFDYLGRDKSLRIRREENTEVAFLKQLAAKGVVVSQSNRDCLLDTLFLQEEDFATNDTGVTPVFENFGWIKLPRVLEDGRTVVFDLCYRANELIGSHQGQYIGSYDIGPYGNYETWKRLIEEEVVGHPVMELLLIAALAAVVNGLITPVIGGSNPILHVYYASGKGKSTILMLCASVAGRPFEGEQTEYDDNCNLICRKSLFQSWSSTDNAMVTSQAGNRGMPTILNELGKNMSPNMTRLLFDLSEGSDKQRLTKELATRVSEGYSTVFISCGESSLLDRCKSKYEGLKIRVMEINEPVTDSAQQARRIKRECTENGGFAIPMLAQHIIDNGGLDYVLPIYNRWTEQLEAEFPPTPSMERFVEKFAALLMATAEIATEALGIAFDMDGLLTFLKDYDAKNGPARNTAASSYDIVIETCRINSHRFFIRNDKTVTGGRTEYDLENTPRNEIWGRITYKHEKFDANHFIVQEFEVRKSIVEEILEKKNFSNIDTCIAAWKAMGVLDYEDDSHPHRKRKIDPNAKKGAYEYVFVFRVFGDPKEAAEQPEAVKAKPRSSLARTPTLTKSTPTPPPNSKREFLLGTDEEVDET